MFLCPSNSRISWLTSTLFNVLMCCCFFSKVWLNVPVNLKHTFYNFSHTLISFSCSLSCRCLACSSYFPTSIATIHFHSPYTDPFLVMAVSINSSQVGNAGTNRVPTQQKMAAAAAKFILPVSQTLNRKYGPNTSAFLKLGRCCIKYHCHNLRL